MDLICNVTGFERNIILGLWIANSEVLRAFNVYRLQLESTPVTRFYSRRQRQHPMVATGSGSHDRDKRPYGMCREKTHV